MSTNNLIFVIIAEQGYIRNTENLDSFYAQNDILFSAISDTYIPLLNMLSRLEKDRIPFKIALVISPVLCTLLSDAEVQNQYIDYLDRRIAFGNEELERQKDAPLVLEQVKLNLKKLMTDRVDFIETYSCSLLDKIKYFASKGYVELIPTTATYAYLPHYEDLTEVLNAQVETGLYAQRHFFSDSGEGFLLPNLGWTSSTDRVLRSYGINYTIVDTRTLLYANPIPENGIFSPVRSNHSLVLFARDRSTPSVINGNNGFMYNKVYRCQQRDIGFDLNSSDMETFLGRKGIRVQTGFKYWANGEYDEDNIIYDANLAEERVQIDAKLFFEEKKERLTKASIAMKGKPAILTCTIPATLLGQNWYEGINWLEKVIRLVANDNTTSLSLFREHLGNQFDMQKIRPYPAAASGTGYAEELLDGSNSWMIRYIRKASERMIDLTDRYPAETGLKSRLLNLAAKELLLAQSSDWPRMIQDSPLPDYARDEFKKHILSFSKIFDSLASNTVSTEWLINMEKKNPIFPWLTYKIFSRKK